MSTQVASSISTMFLSSKSYQERETEECLYFQESNEKSIQSYSLSDHKIEKVK